MEHTSAWPRVAEVAEGADEWREIRSFLVRHLPFSWQLLGAVLRAEASKGSLVPRAEGRRWFVARSLADGAESLRGVLIACNQRKQGPEGEHKQHHGDAIDLSIFVPEHGDDATVRALLCQSIDWSAQGEVRFAGFWREWLPIVKEVAGARGAHEAWYNPCLALHCPESAFKPTLTREQAASLIRDQSLQLDSLHPDSTDPHVVVSKWKYASEESDNYITACVSHAPSACIRNGSELVSWIGVHWDMSLGFFWVEEAFRRKGLGKALAVEQVYKTFDYVRPYLDPDQVEAYFFTEDSNDASKALFQSLGFKVFADVFWGSFVRTAAHSAEEKTTAVTKPLAKVNLAEKLGLFSDYWNPRIVGEVDDFDVKLAKLKGEFIWHKHDNEDELFLIIKGNLVIQIRESGQERDINLREGEFFIVPKGIEHKPVAEEECCIMLLEKRSVVNTGNLRNERTRDRLEHL